MPKPTTEKLGIRRTDYTGGIQESRGKKNIAYELPDGRQVFAKFAQKTGAVTDPFAGLHREKQLLDTLADTGVTPRPLELKVSGNGQEARLLMEKLQGKALDSPEFKKQDHPLQKNPEQVVHAIGASMQKINEKGVLVVDINEGTFLVNENDPEQLTANILDFEIGVDLNALTPEEASRAEAFYRKQDIGLRIAEQSPDFSVDATVLKQAETRKTAATIVRWLLGYPGIWKPIPLSSERQAQYERMAAEYKPIIEQELTTHFSQQYDRLKEKGGSLIASTETKEVSVAKALRLELQSTLDQVLIGCTLQERLEQKNIALSDQTVRVLERSLSPVLAERPTDFTEFAGEAISS